MVNNHGDVRPQDLGLQRGTLSKWPNFLWLLKKRVIRSPRIRPGMPILQDKGVIVHLQKIAYSPSGTIGSHMCQGLNSHYFHIVGDGHQPNSRGLYTHYKDSLLKVG